MDKQTIAVDIDDVLATNARDFIDFTNKQWGTNLTIEDYDEHWMKVWQIEDEEATRRADVYHRSGVFGSYLYHDNSREVLARLHEKFRIIIVTSRRILIEKETRTWLKKYYDGSIDDVHFAGFYDNMDHDFHTQLKQTKGDLLRDLKADYFIDDQIKHCLSADEHGIKSILFGDYTWNQTADLPESIKRCHNWGEVAEYFRV